MASSWIRLFLCIRFPTMLTTIETPLFAWSRILLLIYTRPRGTCSSFDLVNRVENDGVLINGLGSSFQLDAPLKIFPKFFRKSHVYRENKLFSLRCFAIIIIKTKRSEIRILPTIPLTFLSDPNSLTVLPFFSAARGDCHLFKPAREYIGEKPREGQHPLRGRDESSPPPAEGNHFLVARK